VTIAETDVVVEADVADEADVGVEADVVTVDTNEEASDVEEDGMRVSGEMVVVDTNEEATDVEGMVGGKVDPEEETTLRRVDLIRGVDCNSRLLWYLNEQSFSGQPG
jgi:hypothetical protein